MSVTVSDCHVRNVQTGAFADLLYDGNSVVSELWGQMHKVTCINIPVNDETRERVMFTAVHFERSGNKLGKMLNFSSVICNPTYAIRSASITASDSQNFLKLALTENTPRYLSGISGQDIARDVIRSFPEVEASERLTEYSNYHNGQPWGEGEMTDGFFALMIRNTSLNSSAPIYLLDYLDDQILKEHSTAMYNVLAAQVVGRYLALSSTSSLNISASNLSGSITELQDRSTIRELPLRLMEGILLLVLCLALFVSVVAPRNVAPRSPDSIAVLAAIFARNTAAFAGLRDAGHLDLDIIRLKLSERQYWTAVKFQNGLSTFIIQSSINNNLTNHVNLSLIESTSAIT